MNFNKLFMMQKGLDEHIEIQHGLLEENLFDRKILALLVELGELANETRCFKFWSLKAASDREVILEEFVDGVHFILSLGLECGHTEMENMEKSDCKKNSVTEQFLYVYEVINQFKQDSSFSNYINMFQGYLDLAIHLGFSHEQIEEAYIKKNEVNYERQEKGY